MAEDDLVRWLYSDYLQRIQPAFEEFMSKAVFADVFETEELRKAALSAFAAGYLEASCHMLSKQHEVRSALSDSLCDRVIRELSSDG